MTTATVECPHCLGDGEEPGAPVDPHGRYLCTVCNGSGEVTATIAAAYTEEEDET
jgi:DnaJ-class molecular chaperone